ncbi:hypothetical protein ACY2GS_004172, partial [Enterobacter asburiae]
ITTLLQGLIVMQIIENTVYRNSTMSLEAKVNFVTYCCDIDSRYIAQRIRQLVFGVALSQLH